MKDIVCTLPLTGCVYFCKRSLISLYFFPIRKMRTVGSSPTSFSYCENINEIIYFEMPLKKCKIKYKCWVGANSINSSLGKGSKNCDNQHMSPPPYIYIHFVYPWLWDFLPWPSVRWEVRLDQMEETQPFRCVSFSSVVSASPALI